MLSSPPTEEEIKDAVLLQILIALQDLMDFLAPSTGLHGASSKMILLRLFCISFMVVSSLDRSMQHQLPLFRKRNLQPPFSDFRPISLCNFSYKVITKILSNRLSRLLPLIISKEQGAFVKDRLISDNITIAHELVREIDRHTYGGNIIFKLYMMKAYDRLEWDFLFAVMG